MQNNHSNHHLTWREADKSWLKAKGRSLRSVLDSAQREDGVSRYVVAGVTTIVVASAVGLSGVFAGPDIASNALASSLRPLTGVVETITGSPGSASAQALQECGPVAADASVDSEAGAADVDISFDPNVPTLLVPDDFPTLPPVIVIDDDDPDNDDPGDDDPGNDDAGNDDPGDDDDNGGDDPGGSSLIGADVNLLGEDVLDIGLLSGNLLGVGVNGLDPDGSGTGLGIDANLQDDDLLDVGVDPQADNPLDVELNGDDVLDGVGGDDLLGGVGGDDLLGGLTEDLLGGGDPLGDILGNDLLGGLLN
jgi:hypothetical protein